MGNKWTVAAIAGFLGGSAALAIFLAGAWWGGATKKSGADKFFDRLGGEDDRPKTPDLPPPLLATTTRSAEHAKLQGKWVANGQILEFAGDAVTYTLSGSREQPWRFVLSGASIDLWERISDRRPWSVLCEGVFRLDGNELVISCGRPGKRPKSPENEGWSLWPAGRFRRNE